MKNSRKNNKNNNKNNFPIIVSVVLSIISLLCNFFSAIVAIILAVITTFYVLFYFDKKVGFYYVAFCAIVLSLLFGILTLCGVFDNDAGYEVKDVYKIKEMNFETKAKSLIYAGVLPVPEMDGSIKVTEDALNKISNEDLLTEDCEGYVVINDIKGSTLNVKAYIRCSDKYMTTGFDVNNNQ